MKVNPLNKNVFSKKIDDSFNIFYIFGNNLGLIDICYSRLKKNLQIDLENPFSTNYFDENKLLNNTISFFDELNSISLFNEKKTIILDIRQCENKNEITKLFTDFNFSEVRNTRLIILSYIFKQADILTQKILKNENSICFTCYEEEKNNLRPIFLHSAEAPLVVMIDAGSASASEIVASALKDHDAALIVGERSFGKATVQSLESLGDVIIKLTTARYYAPDGYTIQVYGVHPDVAISPEADGTFPPRFREEDMWQHLPELQERKKKPARQAWVKTLSDAVGENEAAEKFLKEHKDDAIKPDAALIRAIAYFDALKKYPRP